MNKLFLTVTVGPDYSLLSKFLNYYKKLGITNFLIILNTPAERALKCILQRHGINPVHTWLEPFSEQAKQIHERLIVIEYCSYEDWVIYADLDEFQHYPMGLMNQIRYCEENGIDYLEGKLIDRVSHDGTLIPINPKISLTRQFPLRGFITNNLLKAWDKKIIIAKGKLIVGGGHHIFLDRTTNLPLSYNAILNKYSQGIEIHHYKWDDKLLTRMQKYIRLQDESLSSWKKEMKRFLKHYDRYSRINIEDKRFKFTRC
jgi:hypothetical protein